jgi:phage terminase, large subunit, PBSX family
MNNDWTSIDKKLSAFRNRIMANAIRLKQRFQNGFIFQPFSVKQSKVLTWWCPSSPVKDMDGIIADGAIRSGKTLCMSLSFVIWAMTSFNGQNFGMCGKTIGSFRRNVLFWLKLMLKSRGYGVNDHRADNLLVVTRGDTVNNFYIFGGKDERSQDLIQGITLAGCFFDEVALMPESFVNQATGRCSVKGSKFWFNCNPQGPMHWFKTNWIDKAIEKRLLYLHFTMDDNLSLDEDIKKRYIAMYVGVFFKRYILGLWVMAEGAIYDMFHDGLLFNDSNGPDLRQLYTRYYAIDYGTTNPCVFLEIIRLGRISWVVDEYYYNSRKEGRQKDDEEYVNDLLKFIGDKAYNAIIVDPSAASFKIAGKKKGLRFRDADNEVLDGIRLVASMLATGMLRVHEKCINFRNEISSYIWDDKAAERGIEQPLKENDHAMDAIRYYCKTIIKVVRV